MGPSVFFGHVHTLPSMPGGAPLLPCMITQTGYGIGLRERRVVSLANPFSLVTALLTEGLDALLKGQLWAQLEATPSRERRGCLRVVTSHLSGTQTEGSNAHQDVGTLEDERKGNGCSVD